jgi:predicted metal-dependent phosphoesterase TrpH
LTERSPRDAKRVDLHVHTNASDGMFPPEEVVDRARAAGLAAIAVTDHDTVAGLPDALAAGEKLGVEVVRGVELTAYAGRSEIHIVGLFVDPSRADIVRKIDAFKEARHERMLRMVAKLKELGVDVEPDDVLAEAGGGAVGRPHLAAALVKCGAVTGAQQAFDRYLGNDGPVYEKKKEMTPEEAITLVGELGGLAVFAHPATSRTDKRLGEFKELGLAAIEILHYKHGPADIQRYTRLAENHGLLISGGSDFHGPGRSPTPIGVPEVGYEVLEALRERHAVVRKARACRQEA